VERVFKGLMNPFTTTPSDKQEINLDKANVITAPEVNIAARSL